MGLFTESVSLYSYVAVYLEHIALGVDGDVFMYRGYANIQSIAFWP